MSYYIHVIYTIIYICMPLKASSTGNTVYRYRFLFKKSRSKSNLSYSDQKWPFRNAEITNRKQGVHTDFFRRTPVRPYIVGYMKKPLIAYGSSGAVYPTTRSQSNRKNNISRFRRPFFSPRAPTVGWDTSNDLLNLQTNSTSGELLTGRATEDADPVNKWRKTIRPLSSPSRSSDANRPSRWATSVNRPKADRNM